MKISDYFEAVKARLNIESDYALSKVFGIHNGHLAQMKKGARNIPLEIQFKIAITLELDPAQVVADIESQLEKNEAKRAFWTGFISRARAAVLMLTCTLALSFSGMHGNGAAALGGFSRNRKLA